MTVKSKSKFDTTIFTLKLIFVLATLAWVGFNVFGTLFSGDPCLRAKAKLRSAQTEEEQMFIAVKKAAEGELHKYEYPSDSPSATIQRRMYAEQDVVEACNP